MEKPRRTRRYCRRSFHKCHRYKTSTGVMGSLPKTQFECRTSTLLSRDSTYPVTSARRTVRFHPIFSTIHSTSHSLHGHLLRAVTTLLTWLTNVYQASPSFACHLDFFHQTTSLAPRGGQASNNPAATEYLVTARKVTSRGHDAFSRHQVRGHPRDGRMSGCSGKLPPANCIRRNWLRFGAALARSPTGLKPKLARQSPPHQQTLRSWLGLFCFRRSTDRWGEG